MSKNKQKKDITEELDRGKILPLVFRLAVPVVIAQLITFLYNIVDRMYVSRIAGSGMDALAALGIVLPITLIIQACANLVGLGGAPRAGIKMGEDNFPEANKIFNTASVMLFIMGVVIGAITLIFSKEIVVLFGCPESAVDFAVSYLRIYSAGTIFVMLAQGLNPFIQTQGYSFIAMGSVLLGAVINIVLDPIFIFTLNMGVSGSSLATVISLPLNGLGNGMQPFVSYNYGRGNAERLTKGIRYVTIIAFIFALSVWSLSLAVPEMYAHLFSALTNFLGFKGVYLSEGIADLVAGVITTIVIFTSFPRIFKRRAEEVKAKA